MGFMNHSDHRGHREKTKRFLFLSLCPLWLLWLPITAAAADTLDHTQPLSYLDDQGRKRPVTTPKDWARRRTQILMGMQEAMGPLPDRTKLPALDVKVTGETRGDGFTRVTLTFVAEGTDRVPADLYLPTTAAKGTRLPAVLALHQTSPRGTRDLAGDGTNPNMGYAPELARHGYVVLCPDYPSFGDYPYDFAKDNYVSGSMKGVFNHLRAVDLLASRDEVDADRIAVIGHSLGGHNAMFLAAFDERVKAVVTSCGWTPFGDYYGGRIAGWTSERYMPRLKDVYQLDPRRVPFDFQEVVAAIAPRWFFSSSPVRDDNFAVAGVKKAAAAAQPVFDLLGASERLQVRYPESGHDFPPEVRREAYAFLDKALGHTPPAAADYAGELPRIPPKEPAEALNTFQVIPGFRIEQVAAEPLVRDPIAMSFDEDGRLFVIEMCDYSEQDKEFLGRVRLLEDADGDGRFDKSTVYADKLSWPTAIVCSGGGVFVGAAPDIYYLKDADGDGKADERRTVFTGFRRDNVQGLFNSFQWTLDNRIQGATSLSGGKVRRADVANAPEIDLGGRDFSFNPKTLDLRPESGGAQHGMTFDDWGRKFVCSNSDHIQMVMFEDRYLARNPSLAAPGPRVSIAADGPQAKVFRISPVEPWRVVRTRLRVAGLAPGPIEGGGTPAGYFTGATGTTIYRGDAFPPEYRGQAFVGDVGSNIIHRKILAPDGVGFVARRADEGKEFVASTDTWFRPAQFANAPDGTLYVADMYREVIEHPASLPPEIKKHLDLTSGRERGRIYRVVPEGYTQRPRPRLGRATTDELVHLLEHRNGWHRDAALRLLFERAGPGAAPALEKLASDSKLPEARMHALYALDGQRALSPAAVARALGDTDPRVREHAVRLAERVRGVSPELKAKLAALATDPDIRVRYQVAFTLGDMAPADRGVALAGLLRRDGADRWMRLAVLSSLGDVDQLFDAIEALPETEGPLVESLLAGLDRTVQLRDHVRAGGNAERVLAKMLQGAGSAAVDSHASVAARSEAARLLSLGTYDAARGPLSELLSGKHPAELQIASLSALDQFDAPDVGRTIIAQWPGFTPRVRAAATGVLFGRPQRTAALLDAIEAGKINPSDVDPARLKQLATGDADPALRERAARVLAGAGPRARDEVIAAYRPALELKGDPDKGRVFFRATCAACHRLEGVGHEIGPNLAAMSNRGAEAVLINVLDPNREVTPQYVDYVVETTDGRTLTGVLAGETANSITLRRAENVTDTVLRTNIKRMRSGRVSIMPEGLEQQLDQQGMADLISYIMDVK
jgi:putative membrane-bound dehydrogenase-like protein